MSQYIAGTVAVTNGSAAVVGTGTLFAANVTAGDLFTVQGSSVPYVVGSITDDTHLTLTANYAGADDAAAAYAITTSFTPTLGIPYMEQQDLDTATIFKRAMLQIEALLTGNASIGALNMSGDLNIGSGNVTVDAATGKLSSAASLESAANTDDSPGAGGVSALRIVPGNASTAFAVRQDTSNALNIDYFNGSAWSSIAAFSSAGLAVNGIVDLKLNNSPAVGTRTTLTMVDDSATYMTPAHAKGMFFLFGDNAGGDGCIVSYNASAGQSFLQSATGNCRASTGVLSGTTGVDTTITISPHTDGRIYIENRRGYTITISFFCLGHG